MSVDVCQGSPLQIKTAAQTINGAAGRTLALNNVVWWTLMASVASVITTATAGNRIFFCQLLDASGNVIFRVNNSLAQSASNAWFYDLGAGLPNFATNSTLSWSTPFPTYAPPGSSIQVFDSAGIDVNDTVAWNLFFGT